MNKAKSTHRSSLPDFMADPECEMRAPRQLIEQWENWQEELPNTGTSGARKFTIILSSENRSKIALWLTVLTSWQEECDRNPGYMVGDGDGAVGHCKASCGTCLARLSSGEHPI